MAKVMYTDTDNDGDTDQCDVTYVMKGSVPAALSKSKPANSVMARTTPSAAMRDGPFGGKKPQG